MIESDSASRDDEGTLAYGLLVTVEELLEFGAIRWATLILVKHL